MNWKVLAAGVLACVLAAVGVIAGILTFGSKVTSLRHTGAFKASARLYKVSHLNCSCFIEAHLTQPGWSWHTLAPRELISATAFALAKRLFPAAACRPPACPLSRRNHQITQHDAVIAGRCHPSRREAAALQWNHWHMVHGSADAGGHALEGKPAVRARPAITDTHCITGLHLGVSALFCHKPTLTAGPARAQQGMWT